MCGAFPTQNMYPPVKIVEIGELVPRAFFRIMNIFIILFDLLTLQQLIFFMAEELQKCEKLSFPFILPT